MKLNKTLMLFEDKVMIIGTKHIVLDTGRKNALEMLYSQVSLKTIFFSGHPLENFTSSTMIQLLW